MYRVQRNIYKRSLDVIDLMNRPNPDKESAGELLSIARKTRLHASI